MWCFIQTPLGKNSKSEIKVFKSNKSIENVALDLFKTYDFNDSEKSLDMFLEDYKDDIIMSIEDDEISQTIEAQGFLEYKNSKWYKKHEYENNLQKLGKEALSPQKLLDLGIEYHVFTKNDILNELVSPTFMWNYVLQKVELSDL